MPEKIDIASNRAARKWSKKELVGRLLWSLVQPLFRFSPRQFRVWRRFLLRVFGARIGCQAHIDPSVVIAIPWNLEVGNWSAIGQGAVIYSLGKIRIGEAATISQFAHLCAGTHDYRDPALPLIKPPIVIGDKAWVCADAFIGPNVTVGEGAIAAACSVVIKDVAPWTIVGGNPARFIKERVITSEE